MSKSAEEMYEEYLAAGGSGALGSVDYFREVAESADARDNTDGD